MHPRHCTNSLTIWYGTIQYGPLFLNHCPSKSSWLTIERAAINHKVSRKLFFFFLFSDLICFWNFSLLLSSSFHFFLLSLARKMYQAFMSAPFMWNLIAIPIHIFQHYTFWTVWVQIWNLHWNASILNNFRAENCDWQTLSSYLNALHLPYYLLQYLSHMLPWLLFWLFILYSPFFGIRIV